MNQHRSLLAGVLALVLGLVLGGGGCATGGGSSATSGDDGGSSDATSDAVGDASGDGTTGCSAGKVKCGGTCTSTSTDPKNCGMCGHVCSSTQVCSAGACGAGCASGETLCGGSAEAGAPEAASSNDSGAADDGSAGDDASGASDTGAPAPVDSGTGGGDGGSVAPYCANTSNDPANCGGCGITCPSGTCTNGSCVVGTCPAGQVGCPASGTCIPTGTCCTSSEPPPLGCSITGEVCPMPGGVCQCPSGEKECMGNMSCISDAACCTDGDCTNGGKCNTPGSACTCPISGTLQCCSATDCATEPNVMTALCSTSANPPANQCSVGACTAGCYDLDSNYSDGCECCDTTDVAHACASVGAPAAIAIGATVNLNGTIPEPTGGDWYAFAFAATPAASLTFHPKITLSANPSTEFVFEVLAGSCSGAPLSCGTEGGAASAVTTWETSYTGPSPAADPTSYPVTGSHFQPIPSVGTVFVHVFRASTTSPATCDQYTLTVSE